MIVAEGKAVLLLPRAIVVADEGIVLSPPRDGSKYSHSPAIEDVLALSRIVA